MVVSYLSLPVSGAEFRESITEVYTAGNTLGGTLHGQGSIGWVPMRAVWTHLAPQVRGCTPSLSQVQEPVLGQAAQMMVDVSAYLPVDDEPISWIEDIVSLPKSTTLGSGGHLRGFRPPRNVDIPVQTIEHHALNLTGYIDGLGQVYLALNYGRDTLRKHHTHSSHYNPDGDLVDGPHMHFPSRKYALVERGHSYAYPLDDSDEDYDDITKAVEVFCSELDITITTWQPYLPGGGV